MGTLFGLIVLIADIYALYQIITSSASTGHKVLWSLGVIIFPVIGFIVWLIAGPRGKAVDI